MNFPGIARVLLHITYYFGDHRLSSELIPSALDSIYTLVNCNVNRLSDEVQRTKMAKKNERCMNEIKRNGVAIGKHKEFVRFVHADILEENDL